MKATDMLKTKPVIADTGEAPLTIPGLSSSKPRRPMKPLAVAEQPAREEEPPSRPTRAVPAVPQPTSGGTGTLESNVSELRRKYGYKE